MHVRIHIYSYIHTYVHTCIDIHTCRHTYWHAMLIYIYIADQHYVRVNGYLKVPADIPQSSFCAIHEAGISFHLALVRADFCCRALRNLKSELKKVGGPFSFLHDPRTAVIKRSYQGSKSNGKTLI